MAEIEVPIGTTATEVVEVTPERTVGHFLPGMPAVFATPMMIHLMETAAAAAVKPYLPEGWTSVGTHVDVRHLAATPVGFEVTATAKVVARDERTVTFEVEAHDGIDLVGSGTHVRAPVEQSRF